MMKKKLVKKSTKKFLLFSLIVNISLFGCKKQSERLYDEAYAEIEKGHYRIAVDLLDRSANEETDNLKKTKALIEAARISRFEIQDYNRALKFNRSIILSSEDPQQRIKAQEALSEIYLENIQDFHAALKEFLILEPLLTDKIDKEKIKLKIAQAQLLSGNALAALESVDLSSKTSGEYQKHFLKMKSQILTSLKRFDDSLNNYETLRKLDETFFKNENLYITASFVYEEKEDYAGALKYLEKYSDQINDKTYLEIRNKRLQERLINKPFFKGRRK